MVADDPADDPYEPFRIALQPEPWMEDANCKGLSPDLFQLEQGQSAHRPRQVCDACTVREPCLDYALRTDSVGVWAGEVFDLKKGRAKKLLQHVDDARPQKVAVNGTRRRSAAAPVVPVQRIAANRHRA